MPLSEEYKVVMSIGMRCFTEIFLKSMGLKKISSPFDGMYSSNIYQIIDIFENGIKHENLTFSENMLDSNIVKLNKEHGYRTMRDTEIDADRLVQSFHRAFLPHHNLNDQKCRSHFERCFHRLENIKEYKIHTLFCLFVHPGYGNSDVNVTLDECTILAERVTKLFNGKLLVCVFNKSNTPDNWKIIHEDGTLVYTTINSNSHVFNEVKTTLNEIFLYMKIDHNKLLTYDDITNLSKTVDVDIK